MKRFRVRCEMTYQVDEPVVFLMNVRAQNHEYQHVVEESFLVDPPLQVVPLPCAITGNRFDRVHAETPGSYRIIYEAVVEVTLGKYSVEELSPTTPGDFDLRVLPFLYPSRYCQSDRLSRLAADHFGDGSNPVRHAQAIVHWISGNVSYVSGSTNANTSAVDTVVERVGVCRDFAHLGIAFCRSLNIPARYFSCYAMQLEPPDFHACFETWIGGRWVLWDATGLASPDSVVCIGRGRDAADISVCTSFGKLQLQEQAVSCVRIDAPPRKMTEHELLTTAVSHGTDLPGRPASQTS